MMKVMTCLIGCFLFAFTVKAQGTANPADTSRLAVDSAKQTSDTARMVTMLKDSGIVRPATSAGDSTGPDGKAGATDSAVTQPGDSASSKLQSVAANPNATKTGDPAVVTTVVSASVASAPAPGQASGNQGSKDTTVDQSATTASRQLDTRWFISPLLKLQFQDFAMLEKNREGYLSNANTLPFFSRGNASFAASAYKNLTGRLSVSADLGLSFGHVTSDAVQISQTKSQTFNLLNATVYYHLLPATYRLQPYVEVGINDIINSASYLTVPMGIGAKFTSRKVMALAEVSYGEAIGKNIANTTMYSLGLYIPIGGKKHKQLDTDENPYNKTAKDEKKKDTAKPNGTVINNIYVTINMDSVLRAKGLLNDDGSPRASADDDADGNSGHSRRQRRGLRNFDVDDFGDNDYKMDSLDGKPAIRFVVYFEFNDFGLNSSAFESIDKVIGHLRRTPNQFTVEIKGYTDSVGNDHYNNWLSRERAKMVLKYMNSRGIPADLMQAKAYGKDDPVADNGDPSKAWLNRRAEIIVHAKESLANDK